MIVSVTITEKLLTKGNQFNWENYVLMHSTEFRNAYLNTKREVANQNCSALLISSHIKICNYMRAHADLCPSGMLQCTMVLNYQHFRTTYLSCLEGSSSPRTP
jgi:hypothetical protein